MTTFKDLQFKPHPAGMGGVQARHDFPNGYGVSVIQTSFSYGGEDGKYELAVMHNGSITYDTYITNDVEGHLSEEDVTEILGQVEALPKQGEG